MVYLFYIKISILKVEEMSQDSENQSMGNLEQVREKMQKQYASEVRKTVESADIVIEVCYSLR